MRKIIALAFVAAAAVAVVPAAHAAPRCTAPVSTQCVTTDEDGNDQYCDVFIDVTTDGGSVGGCITVAE